MAKKASDKNKHGGNTKDERFGMPDGRSQRGRPPKPIDLHAALELTLIGSSIRDKARRAGCSARTLMGRHAPQIELAEARISGFLKMRLFQLAVVEGDPQALFFLVRRMYDQENGGERNSEKKWSRRQFQQALRIVWRHSLPKPKRNFTPFRLKGRKYPRRGNRTPAPKPSYRGER